MDLIEVLVLLDQVIQKYIIVKNMFYNNFMLYYINIILGLSLS